MQSSPLPPAAPSRDATLPICAEERLGQAVWLRVEVGSAIEATLRLAPGAAVVVGSGDEAQLRISDRTVSARHCRVEHVGDGVALEDLQSTNGVRVAGARVSRAVLRLGASFELGRAMVWLDPGAPADAVGDAAPLCGLIGDGPAMRRLARDVRRVAPLRLPVLVRGESGTGKELVARSIHSEGPRASRPFVAINAATISRELGESELFGHERGAFTGASRDRRGAFREAHGGTLFLDEIGAVPQDVQAKLLRVVEDGVVRPVGSEKSLPVDVRLVAATCEALETLVGLQRFRADLYERLAVCLVVVPPLRDRPGDLESLARHLLAAADVGARDLTSAATTLLRAQRWPGNVRELRNVLVMAALRCPGVVRAEDVAAVLAERTRGGRKRLAPGEALRIYEQAGRNISAAARTAQLPRSTMRDLLRAARRG